MLEELLKAIVTQFESAAGTDLRNSVGDRMFLAGSDIRSRTPFLTINVPASATEFTMESTHQFVTVNWNVWDEATSPLTVTQIMEKIKTAYSDVILTMANFTMIRADLETEFLLEAPDKGWQGIVGYEYRVAC